VVVVVVVVTEERKIGKYYHVLSCCCNLRLGTVALLKEIMRSRCAAVSRESL